MTFGRIDSLKSKFAFTLAEVLITLTIIGVIAAITIPNLMQSYKKHQVEAGVKEAYSILSNAIKMSEAENGISMAEMIAQTGIGNWTNINFFSDNYFLPYIKYNKLCKAFDNCKNISPIKDYSNYWTDKGNIPKIILANGMFVTVGLNNYNILFSVDIDGLKGKNADGADTFYFYYNYYDKILRGGNSLGGNSCDNNGLRKCSDVIMKNSWKIPDNYPVKKF